MHCMIIMEVMLFSSSGLWALMFGARRVHSARSCWRKARSLRRSCERRGSSCGRRRKARRSCRQATTSSEGPVGTGTLEHWAAHYEWELGVL